MRFKLGTPLLLLTIGIGCQTARVTEERLTVGHGGSEAAAQMEFWHRLAVRPLASNDEAFHGLLLYADGEDRAGTYEERVEVLRSRGMLPNGFSGAADEAVDRGTLSVAFVKMLNLRGGLTMSVFGPVPRYATRLLVYRGIYPEGTPNMAVSGADFVGFIGKVEDFQRENVEKPAALLPGEGAAEGTSEGPLSFVLSENFQGQEIEGLVAADLPDFRESLMLVLQVEGVATTAPATGPATLPAVSTEVIVDGVEGKFVQVRAGADQPWRAAEVGQRYGANAEFRTGPRSAVRFVIPPDQTYTLDRVSTVRVSEITAQGRTVTTNVDMLYGRVRYDLEPISEEARGTDRSPYQVSETGIEHSTTIRSPNSTLAVRGTRVSLYDQPPYLPQAVSLVGRAEFQNARRQMVAFGGRQMRTNRVNANQPSAAEAALAETIVDPTIRAARPAEDAALLSTLLSRGSVVTFDRGSGLNIVRGGSPPGDRQLVPALPGQINFVLRWTGNANLDLSVANQAGGRGEFVYPAAGVHTSPSGGTTRFDHRGGPKGGMEVVYWVRPSPTGFYSVGVNHVSGKATNAAIDVFQDGKRIDLVDLGGNGGQGEIVTTFRTRVDPKTTAAVLVPVGVPPPPIGHPQQRSGKGARGGQK